MKYLNHVHKNVKSSMMVTSWQCQEICRLLLECIHLI
jgi:hypothetical protein